MYINWLCVDGTRLQLQGVLAAGWRRCCCARGNAAARWQQGRRFAPTRSKNAPGGRFPIHSLAIANASLNLQREGQYWVGRRWAAGGCSGGCLQQLTETATLVLLKSRALLALPKCPTASPGPPGQAGEQKANALPRLPVATWPWASDTLEMFRRQDWQSSWAMGRASVPQAALVLGRCWQAHDAAGNPGSADQQPAGAGSSGEEQIEGATLSLSPSIAALRLLLAAVTATSLQQSLIALGQ